MRRAHDPAKKLYSDKFEVGTYSPTQWRILAFVPVIWEKPYLALFLDAPEASTPHHMNPRAAFTLTLVNHRPDKKSFRKESSHTFTPREADWGFTTFYSATEIADEANGWLKDGMIEIKCSVEVEVEVEVEVDITCQEKEDHQKMKAEAIQYCTVMLATDEDMKAQVGDESRGLFFDLVDFDLLPSDRVLRLRKETKVSEIKARMEELTGVPASSQRLWVFGTKQGQLYHVLTSEEEQRPLIDLYDLRDKVGC